jgi:hypothetical protein
MLLVRIESEKPGLPFISETRRKQKKTETHSVFSFNFASAEHALTPAANWCGREESNFHCLAATGF